jgi:hypothetical protein
MMEFAALYGQRQLDAYQTASFVHYPAQWRRGRTGLFQCVQANWPVIEQPRQVVLWFGPVPSQSVLDEFDNRNLALKQVSTADDAEIATSCAAVFSLGTDATLDPTAAAKSLARKLVNYGTRVEFVAADDAGIARLQSELPELPELIKLPIVGVRTAPRDHIIAEAAARHEAGNQPRIDLKIEIADNREPLRTEDRLLLQRGFWSCSSVTLVELTGGRSDARVFAVHMTVTGSLAGVWPQPAFAKLDRKDKIYRESWNYKQYADRFIPFGLRPNIHEVVIGSERGLLVGSFVDRSESLWDLARRNVAAPALTALIEETLSGWRDQAYAEDPVEGSISEVLRLAGIWSADRIRDRYKEFAREKGCDIDLADTIEKLAGIKQRYRIAPAHGDLHGENVRVRSGQAILIDLASVIHKAPLTLDLAALETWLAFELPPMSEPDRQRFEDAAWAAEIDRLYAPETFLHPPGPSDPTSQLCWMTTVVRQLRRMGIAAQCSPTEYETAVAVQLMRRAQWDDGPPADRFRRSQGYLIGLKLLSDVVAKS